jgi:hypothetical protein
MSQIPVFNAHQLVPRQELRELAGMHNSKFKHSSRLMAAAATSLLMKAERPGKTVKTRLVATSCTVCGSPSVNHEFEKQVEQGKERKPSRTLGKADSNAATG